MKTRVIVALISLPLLTLILLFLPPWVLVLFVAALCGIALWELMFFTGVIKRVRMMAYATLFTVFIPLWAYFDLGYRTLLGALFVLLLLVFAEAILAYGDDGEIGFFQISGLVFAALIIPLLFSSLVKLATLEDGRFYVLLPFIIAFTSDGGAYFTGVFFGKHKLAPHVSPKKTVEGSIGGIVSCIAFCVIYGLVLGFTGLFEINYILLALYGFIGSVISQLGDLSFSLLKRGFGIKDYGRLIPGHGGVLDRFDSIIFTAPAVELMLVLAPAFYSVRI